MEITPVRVGGADALDPKSGLPMYRQFTTFEGSAREEYIRVYYEQWLIYPTGEFTNKKTRSYIVIDHAEEGHTVGTVAEIGHYENVVEEDLNAEPPIEAYIGDWVIDQEAVAEHYVVDRAYAPMFTFGWYHRPVLQAWVGAHFGRDIIVGAINETLGNIPFDAPNPFYTRP